MANRLHVISVVGARPNFMKIAPFARAIDEHNRGLAPDDARPRIEHCLVHTGQHYDAEMSGSFFDSLGIPEPDVNLGVGSGSHAEQVGRTMIQFETVVRERRPDWVVVVGDVNATCACAITAKKERVSLAHIESGLRSFDMTMPEEINRLVTDRLADLHFTPDEFSNQNLRNEGVPEDRIHLVGNIMIDALKANAGRAAQIALADVLAGNAIDEGAAPGAIQDHEYAVLTLHRPSNVDTAESLGPIVRFVCGELSRQMPVVWAVHPRTRQRLVDFGLWDEVRAAAGLRLVRPVGYLEMLRLNLGARVMLTDSGGLQEECCAFGTPCVTLRANTERPVTLVEHGGVSRLAGNDVAVIRAVLAECLAADRSPTHPPLWDGRTASRIVEILAGTNR